MEIVELIAEGDKVVAHFRCSGTHRREWLGVSGTGRRFEGYEIYVFEIKDGKLVSALGVEDNLARMRQLGIRAPELTTHPTSTSQRANNGAFSSDGETTGCSY